MIQLSSSVPPDLIPLRRAITQCAVGSLAMEVVAQQIIELLHRELVGDNPTDPEVALTRCFVSCPYSALSTVPELQRQARKLLADEEPAQSHRCLVLLGTRGMAPEWNRRSLSTGHQVIPLGSSELMQKTPMITELCRRIGIPRESFLTDGKLPPLDLAVRNAGLFHIENALDSPFIPSQSGFVRPYGVRSVLGLGSPLSEHDFFAVLIFARVPVSAEVAAALKQLTLSIKLALGLLRNRLFADG